MRWLFLDDKLCDDMLTYLGYFRVHGDDDWRVIRVFTQDKLNIKKKLIFRKIGDDWRTMLE